MTRALLLVLVLAALGAAAWLWQSATPHDDTGLHDDPGRAEPTSSAGPVLEAQPVPGGSAGTGRRAPGTGAGSPSTPPGPAEVPEAAQAPVRLRVRVLDARSGEPVARALVWAEPAGAPCPRLPRAQDDPSQPTSVLSSRVVFGTPTDTTGLALLREGQVPGPEGAALDVFARAPGRVLGMACAARGPDEVVLRLEAGLRLEGVVLRRDGTPLPDASVVVQPAATTTPVPGHAGAAWSDEQGRFVVDGLRPGRVLLQAGAADHMPLEVEDDPAQPGLRRLELVRACWLAFRLRTDDGRLLEHPTYRVAWRSHAQQGLLQVLGTATSDGVLTQALAVPSDAGTIEVQVKAPGYAPWERPAQPVPADGDLELAVTLVRDTRQGTLRVLCEDEAGQPVDWSAQGALPPALRALDGQDLAGGTLVEHGRDLRLLGLPPGRYELLLRTRAYAPVQMEARVTGGTDTEQRVRLRPPARVRVRFTAPQARIVRFRLLQGGAQVLALPEGAGATAGTDDEPVLAAGAEGVVLGGLASGDYEVEVTSEDLRPTRTRVSLREGELREVTVAVEPL